MAYQISRGKIQTAQKVVIYGPEGIGKSTFASQFPDPLFIDTEGSTKHMDVARYPKPTSWSMLLEEVRQIKASPGVCKTLIIDTADWAEALCIESVCAKAKKSGIEDFGYGKGYVYAAEEFGRLLNLLEELVESGVNIVLTAHAKMRKFEQPDEMGAYDRWEMKLSKNVGPLIKEWADMVLFANYKTFAVAADDKGKKFKAQGGSRVMYTAHHPCWDAKNRHGLPDELPLDYSGIAHCLSGAKAQGALTSAAPEPAAPKQQAMPVGAPPAAPEPRQSKVSEALGEFKLPTLVDAEMLAKQGVPPALADLMAADNVELSELQEAVASKGYYPKDTPVAKYDPAFVWGVLIAAWEQVLKIIIDNRDLPFE